MIKPNKKLYGIFENKNLNFCIVIFLLVHTLLFLGFWYGNEILHNAAFPYPIDTQSFWLNFVRWDSNWYLGIAQHGYSTSTDYAVQQNYAFFPLYPLLISLMHRITGLSYIFSGVVISNICFLVALIYFKQLLKQLQFDETQQKFGVLLLALSPANIYFASVYTESLFLALSIMSICFAYRQQWLYASINGLLISAARPNGVLIIIPLVLIAWQAYIIRRQWQWSYCSLCLVPMGLIAYMFYLHVHIGDFLAFKHAQIAWGRTGWHLHGFWLQLRSMIQPNQNSLFFLLFIVASVYLYKHKYWPELLFGLVMIAPALLSGGNGSFERYSGVLFSVYIGFLVLSKKHKDYQYSLLAFSAFFLGLNVIGWIMSLQLA